MAVIPAFSLQRMQEIVHILVQELVDGKIELGADEYIYVDSKL
jgi:Cft2 family RNA processing exonuclease